MPESTGPLINMRQLANQLRISRQTLTVWLDRWPDFPICERGTNGREYAFDAAAVFDFLRAKQAEDAASTAARDAALAQLTLPFALLEDDAARPAVGVSLKDQISALKLRQLQREEAEASSRLVEASEVSHVLVTCFTQLNRALHHAIRQAARDHNLPDAVARSLEGRMEDAQRAFVRDASGLMAKAPELDV